MYVNVYGTFICFYQFDLNVRWGKKTVVKVTRIFVKFQLSGNAGYTQDKPEVMKGL